MSDQPYPLPVVAQKASGGVRVTVRADGPGYDGETKRIAEDVANQFLRSAPGGQRGVIPTSEEQAVAFRKWAESRFALTSEAAAELEAALAAHFRCARAWGRDSVERLRAENDLLRHRLPAETPNGGWLVYAIGVAVAEEREAIAKQVELYAEIAGIGVAPFTLEQGADLIAGMVRHIRARGKP